MYKWDGSDNEQCKAGLPGRIANDPNHHVKGENVWINIPLLILLRFFEQVFLSQPRIAAEHVVGSGGRSCFKAIGK